MIFPQPMMITPVSSSVVVEGGFLEDANPPLNGSPPPPPDIGGVSGAGSGVEVGSLVSSGGTNAVDDRVF